jgi:preprotein translocase subunit SecA
MLAQQAFPVLKDVYEKQGGNFENILIPITDGKKTLNVVANVKKAYDTQGKEVPLAAEKGITLAIIDDAWKEHLREMDDLKQSVQTASYEQKDPLLIYKFESFNLFKNLILKINKDICAFLSLGKLPAQNPDSVREAKMQRTDTSRLKVSRPEYFGNSTSTAQKPSPVHVEKKIGRNDPCPCGSGKKYKQCHGVGA